MDSYFSMLITLALVQVVMLICIFARLGNMAKRRGYLGRNCPHCDEVISKKATACPHCTRDIARVAER